MDNIGNYQMTILKLITLSLKTPEPRPNILHTYTNHSSNFYQIGQYRVRGDLKSVQV